MEVLPAGTLDYLLLPENIAELQSILTYHVLEGAFYSADATAGDVTALNGEPLTVSIVTGSIMLNNIADVISTDIPASNGVVHVIDAVLLPPSFTGEAAVTTTGATGAVETTVAAEATTGATGAVETTVAAEVTVSASTTVAAETTEAAVQGEETTTVATTTAPEMTVSPTATPAEKSG